MTEEFDLEREAQVEASGMGDLDSIITNESIVESSVVPPESSAEEAFAAAANAIPAAGGPIVVDPYAVLSTNAAPPESQPYVAPTYTGPAPRVNYSAPYPGAHGGGYPVHPYPVRPVTDGFAITALICGVAGLIGVLPLIGPILGLVFGLLALQRIGRTGVGGRGLAIAGIVTGGAGLLFSVLLGLLLGLTGLFGLFSWGSVM